MPKILVTGSIAYDLMLGFDGSFADALKDRDMSQLSVSFFSPRFARHHGGTGANISWHVRMLGGDPLLVGTVGVDGSPYLALLRERGIDTTHVEQRAQEHTAFCVLGTDSDERQIVFFHPGADASGSWPDLAEDREDIAWAVVSPRNPVLMLKGVAACADLKIKTLFDPGQQSLIFSADDLRRAAGQASGIIVNAYEWELLRSKLQCTAKDLIAGGKFLIITRGEDGVTIHHDGKEVVLPACAAEKIVNPTGAGDVFRAGLLVGLSKGWDLVDAAQFGAAAASFVVEQEGALLDVIDIDELEERRRRAYA
jgi:adenosine kinase